MEQVRRLVALPTMSQKVAAFCLLYSAIAVILFPHTFADVLSAYPILRFYVVIPLFLAVGLLAAAIIHSPRRPLAFMAWKMKDRGLGALLTMIVLVISASAFTTLKHEYAAIVPFHAETLLADMDAALHFGETWRIARAIFPPALEPILFSLYAQLWFVEVAGVLVYAAFIHNRDDRERYFVAFAVSVILLSSVVRIAGSSAGPIFYDRMMGGDRFAELVAGLKASSSGQGILAIADYLYTSYTTQRTVLGTGISAMPSMHVALAFLNALFLSSRSKIAGRIAWAYAGLIFFGSVYFGWHYALDGYVSMLCVLTIWKVSARDGAEPSQDHKV